ncbi:PTS sugar transporter subunit IIA [Enterococcus sp. LJL99]
MGTNEVNIILASHGEFSKSALTTLEMIAGKQSNMSALSLQPGEGLDEFYQQYKQLVETKPGEWLILTDIDGGTPSNAATQLLLGFENVQVFSGLNIPLLLEIATNNSASLTELTTLIEKNWLLYLTNINKKIVRKDESDEY